ncbi:MAG: efflux transporter outer membrane subunit [Pirellula sp.]
MNVKKRALRKRALAFAIFTGALFGNPGCRIPELCRPDRAQPMPETFNGEVNWDNSACVELHEFFNDPLLTNLVDQALVDNQELKILAQDIRIANNEVLARRGAYFPFVFFGARAGAEKSGEYTREGAVESNLMASGKSFPDPLPDFLVGTNVSWEIDIWKKLRNARSAAALRYLGTNDGRNYVITRLVADIAEDYYDLLALDKQLETLDKTIELQEKSLEVSKAKKEAGRGTELAVQRFQAEVRKNQSEKLVIAQQIVEAENRINFLAGRYPQPIERQSVDFINLNLHSLSAGVPAQLLQNRNDIRQAERELAAAGLEVKVARANFYPSLNISAGVGYRAFNSGFLFTTPASLVYNAFGDVVAPLINRAAIKAAYMTANAEQLQAVYNYQRTVLNAFTEVMNYMSKVDKYGRSIEIKKQQLESLEASVDSATKLFQNARAEYVEVLLAQRDLQDAKIVIIETKKQQLTAIVNAYQALGGGMVRSYSTANSANSMVTFPPDSFSPVTTMPDATAADNSDADKADADRDSAGKVPKIPVPPVAVPPAAL